MCCMTIPSGELLQLGALTILDTGLATPREAGIQGMQSSPV